MYMYKYVYIYIYTVYTKCDPPTVSSIHKTRMSPTQGLGFRVLGFSGVGSSGIQEIINVNENRIYMNSSLIHLIPFTLDPAAEIVSISSPISPSQQEYI